MDYGKEKLNEYISKFVRLKDEQLDLAYSYFKLEEYTKGQSLIQPGDTVETEYFVVDGCLKTFFINDDLKMYILQFAMPTWWASDYTALYSDNIATVSVDCITDTRVLAITNAAREKLCSEIQAVESFFRWRTNKGFVAMQKRLVAVLSSNVQQRYDELLRQYPELYNLVPKHLIAAYLGVSRETLSRLHS